MQSVNSLKTPSNQSQVIWLISYTRSNTGKCLNNKQVLITVLRNACLNGYTSEKNSAQYTLGACDKKLGIYLKLIRNENH